MAIQFDVSSASAWRLARTRLLGTSVHRLARYRDDPVGYARAQGHRLTAYQRAALEALATKRRVLWRGPRKGGKTHTFAYVAVPWFMSSREGIVVTLAPSWDQVRNVMWAGIGKAHATARVPLPGKVDATQWRLGPKHFAIGRATDDPGKLQGLHGGVWAPPDPDQALTEDEYDALLLEHLAEAQREMVDIFVICDEAPSIRQELMDALEGTMQGPNTYWALVGNPTCLPDAEHKFARVASDDSGDWCRIAIHPEPVNDPVGADLRFESIPPFLQRPSWLEERRREWGPESALFKAYGLGLFAGVESDRQVVTLEILEGALGRDVFSETGRHIGVDLSRMGDDRSVACLWEFGVLTAVHVWEKSTTVRSREIIKALRVRWGDEAGPVPAENIHVDMGTFGAAVVDELFREGLQVDGVDFASSPIGDWSELQGETRFANRRAEMHWNFRRVLQEGIAQMAREVNGERNRAWDEAQWPTYEDHPTASGTVLKIEPKDAIKKRHGRSPDYLDAAMLGWCRRARRPRFGKG